MSRLGGYIIANMQATMQKKRRGYSLLRTHLAGREALHRKPYKVPHLTCPSLRKPPFLGLPRKRKSEDSLRGILHYSELEREPHVYLMFTWLSLCLS